MADSYNAANALKYARANWFRACDDESFQTTKGAVSINQKRIESHTLPPEKWRFLFVLMPFIGERALFRDVLSPNPEPDKIVESDVEAFQDCTNFLSRCLRAGGLSSLTPTAKTMVSNLQHRDFMDHLQKGQVTKVIAEKITRSQGQKIIDANVLSEGDVIGYIETNTAGKLENAYHHTALYVGKVDGIGCITCHSTCRFGGEKYPYPRGDEVTESQQHEWHLRRDGWQYTFVHFPTSAEMATSSTMRDQFDGWWQINSNPVFYQYVLRAGKFRWTYAPPKSVHDGIGGPWDGYWFNRNGMKFIRRNSGQVDTWTYGSNRDAFVSVDGGIAVRAVRLF